MKNFKKVLALVLAVATVFTFAAMATAADVTYADLTDTANVTHQEAVQVLVGLGVINGYEDKTFKPTENVTRVQMAKMIGDIMNDGDKQVNDLYKNACPFADSKSNWGAGYIAYCAIEGIVAGRNANTFDPNATVTGVEAAKMLLCALGYKADYEGFVGADWAANTLKKAKEVKLLTDLSQSKMNLALNRDDAAQMIFNALKAEVIEKYSGSATAIEINGAKIVTDPGNAQKYTTVSTIFGAPKQTTWADEHFRDNCGAGDNKLYFVADANSDVFGATSDAWRYGKSNSADNDIANGITLVKTFTTSMTASDLYALTGKYDAATDTLNFQIDGEAATKFTPNQINTASTKTVFSADEIEVYMDDNAAGGRDIQVIGKNYYFGQITAHKLSKNAAIDEYVTIGFGDFINPNKIGTGFQDQFETTAFTDADVDDETTVIFTYSFKDSDTATAGAQHEGIQSVQKVEAVQSGEVTKVSTKDGNKIVTAGGKEYTFRGNFSTIDTKNEYELYVAPNGVVQAAKLVEAGASNFYMVMAKNKNTANTLDDDTTVYSVRLLGTDGKTVDLKVASIDDVKNDAGDTFYKVESDTETGKWADLTAATKATEDMDIAAAVPGSIVTYTLNSKGEAKLKTTGFASVATGVMANTASWKADAATAFNYDNLTAISTDLTGTGNKKATAKTTFVLISLDKNDNYVYTPVTGLAAMKAAVGNYEYKQRTVVTKTGDTFASAAFIFVDSRTETTAKTVFANIGELDLQSEKIGEENYEYKEVVVMEGTTQKKLKVDASTGNTAYSVLATDGFTVAKSYKTNDDGIVTDITPDASYTLTGNDVFTFANDCIKYEDGTLTITVGETTYDYVNDNIKVYLYNREDEEFNSKNVSTLRNENVKASSQVIVLLTNKTSSTSTNTVSAIFVEESAN